MVIQSGRKLSLFVRGVERGGIGRLEGRREVVGADAAFLLLDELFGCVLDLHGETELGLALQVHALVLQCTAWNAQKHIP